MLYTDADSKRLRLHLKPSPMKHLKSVSRTVPDGQDSRPGSHFLFSVDLDRMFFRENIRHLSMETEISAELNDPFSHGLDYICKNVCSDMRLLFVKDFLRSAEGNECLEDKAVPAIGILHECVQLSVGKCSGAALAELDIRFRIEHSGTPELLYIVLPLPHGCAALQYDRTHAGEGKKIGAEQSCRAAAHDNRTSGCSLSPVFRQPVGFIADLLYFVFHIPEDCALLFRLKVNGVYIIKLRFFPRVEGTLPYRIPDQVVRGDPQCLNQPFFQLLLCMFCRKLKLCDAKHI